MRLRRKQEKGRRVATAVADPSAVDGRGVEELREEVARLTEANRAAPDRATERRLLRLRHLAGIRLLEAGGDAPEYAQPDTARLPEAEILPEIAAADVTPGVLRAGILRDGCLLVRGLIDRAAALRFADEIDRSFAERDRHDATGSAAAGYYEEFTPDPRYPGLAVRGWIKAGGGVLAADSPMLTFQMLEMFDGAGVPGLVEGYLGEPAVSSIHKTTLRKAEPSVRGAWHQDGNFMGEVRALNLWLSLSRCGDEAPGLEIVPRRLEGLLPTKTEEAFLDIQVSQSKAEGAAGDKPIVRPIFEPGDALFFDELFLHQTGSDPSMPKSRFAIESWFFGASAFPDDYAPLAIR